jgi:hypothetical protein
MNEFQEKLASIAKVRSSRQEADRQLQAARFGLQQIEQKLAVARSNRVQQDPALQEEINRLQIQLARLHASLDLLNRQIAEQQAIVGKAQDHEKLIAQIKERQQALDAQIQALQQQLAALRQNPDALPADIEKLEQFINSLLLLREDLARDLAIALQSSETLNSNRQQAEAKLGQLGEQKQALRQQITSLYADIAGLQQPAPSDLPELNKQKEVLTSQADTLKNDLAGLDKQLHTDIDALHSVNRHPGQFLPQLQAGIPFLLLPVRLETRFVSRSNNQGTELWLRIYPDDIAIHTHEKIMTQAEITAGELYWTALFEAQYSTSEVESRRQSAWRHLADVFTAQRAAWIAAQTKPGNWDVLINLPQIPAWTPTFPTHEVVKTDSWSAAPKTQVLPDRFVAVLYDTLDTPPHEHVGNIIPDTLYVGPDPMDAANAYKDVNGSQTFGDAFSWMSDFEEAVAAGMGFKIPLSAAQAQRGFARIFVLGVYLSADATGSSQLVEQLIDNHHYSPKGFSLVPQGTATNNTEHDGSGYTTNTDYQNISYYVETGSPLFVPDQVLKTDGQLLATSLGINPAVLQYVRHADARDQIEAAAMNKALYPSTIGYYTEKELELPLNTRVALRTFFTNYVTARGSLPAIRVGDQPYGILLTSDSSNWKYDREQQDTIFLRRAGALTNAFLEKLHTVLQSFQSIWDNLRPNLARVGLGDPEETLANILALHPNSVSFTRQISLSDEVYGNLFTFLNGLMLTLTDKGKAYFFLSSLGYRTGEDIKVPPLLKLNYRNPTLLDINTFIDPKPMSETNGLTVDYIRLLADAIDSKSIEEEKLFGATPPPDQLLYLMLRNAILLELHNGTYSWLKSKTTFTPALDKAMVRTTDLVGIRNEPQFLSAQVSNIPVGVAQPNHPSAGQSVFNYIWNGGVDLPEAHNIQEVKDALNLLKGIPTARLERCFIEHLDLCTYRLDAWQAGLFAERLATNRASENTKNGLYLGAYGWLENVQPQPQRQIAADTLPPELRPADAMPVVEYADSHAGGYVHTPSLNHAAAAALLRNGYLTHATPEEKELMSVNISSERVRRANFILEGMRGGQPIDALLGYQFERGLHDSGILAINRLVLSFREAYPFSQRVLQQQGGGSQVSVPVSNVVNGLTLANATLSPPLFGLNLGTIAPPTPDEQKIILDQQDKLRDTLDAVKDLQIAENAYQLVIGNYDRAAAVNNAQTNLASVYNDHQVIQTPRGVDISFTHRVTLHFEDLDATSPESNPWTTIAMTPRAITEPGMNKWLALAIGDDPAEYTCSVSVVLENGEPDPTTTQALTLAELQLQPVDVVFLFGTSLEGGATELETRVGNVYLVNNKLTDDVTLKVNFGGSGKTFAGLLPLVRQLRTLLMEARPLDAEDFTVDTKAAADAANKKQWEVEELRRRVTTVYDGLNALHADLLTIPVHITITVAPGPPIVSNTTLGAAMPVLEAHQLSFISDPAILAIQFTGVEAETLTTKLKGIAQYGIPDSFPVTALNWIPAGKAKLLDQAHRLSRRLRSQIDENGLLQKAGKNLVNAAVPSLAVYDVVKLLVETGKMLFGNLFSPLPKFNYLNPADIMTAGSLAARTQLLKFASAGALITPDALVEDWLEGLARVRPRLHKWYWISSLAEIYGTGPLHLTPVQLPFRELDCWLGTALPEKDLLETEKTFEVLFDTLSMVMHGTAAALQVEQKQCGLLLDEWTEQVPTANEITGIAFHYNQPNAAPPQTLLLAVSPLATGAWSWDALIGTLKDTFERAQRRAVDPDLLNNVSDPPVNVLLPAIISEFSTSPDVFSVDYGRSLQLETLQGAYKAISISTT